MGKKKDLLYEKFKDRCSDNGITGEESGDIEMCWIIARDILTQERKQELDRAREEGRREALENLHLKLNDCVVYINDNGDIDNGVIGSVNRSIVEELSKLTTK